MAIKYNSVKEQLEAHIARVPEAGCWLWTGYVNSDGYGLVKIGGSNGRVIGAHRVAYEEYVGPFPSHLEMDHLCRVRCCCNPEHLEPVTHKENVLRGNVIQASKDRCARITHCRHGHEYTPENTYRYPSGKRSCRECHKLLERKRRAQRK